jgi:23S rRNA (cytidine2498-2'-O)-methyltransferase
MLHVCQDGFEPFLAKEVNAMVFGKGPGFVRTGEIPAEDSCFGHYVLRKEEELKGASAKAAAQALVDYFLRTSKEEVYDGEWPLLVEGSGEEGASRRANTVEELFLELAKKRMSRVLKLARSGRPSGGRRRGLFAYLMKTGELAVSREAIFYGQRRMADDPQAPSRSYLKVEEAYAVLGEGPEEGQTVIDLGAAPGGWSYSAAKRGAKVLAVDNGPLKGGALHPNIEHRAEDAFKVELTADWLFCDMVEDPEQVLGLVARWLEHRACRRFIVNLKFGRHDPIPLIRRVREHLGKRCSELKVRHLFHDREELTLLGKVS